MREKREKFTGTVAKKFCIQMPKKKYLQCSNKCDGSGKYLCVCVFVCPCPSERICCVAFFFASLFWLSFRPSFQLSENTRRACNVPQLCYCPHRLLSSSFTAVIVVVVGSAAFDDYEREHNNMITLAHTTYHATFYASPLRSDQSCYLIKNTG